MELDSIGDKIAVGVTVLSLAVVALNLVFMMGGGESPLQSLVDQQGSEDQSNTGNGSEKQTPPDYYDKATDDGSSDNPDSKNERLNVSERAEIESDFKGYVKNSERDNGIYLDRKAVAGETNSIWVYSNGDPVQGTEVLVNGQSIGTTSRFGDVFFTVPDTDRIVVRTTTENLGTVENTYKVY